MNPNSYVIIMAGGIGSRFWPYSRNNKPKQFLDILGTGSTLIQMTYERFWDICPPENIFVVTNQDYFDLVKEQLPELSDDQILTEPMRRNTAPCIAYATYKIQKLNPEARIVVTPSDHAIVNEKKFKDSIDTALDACQYDWLMTLGIKPHRPETQYGYIQYQPQKVEGYDQLKKVKTFTEKPGPDLAAKFIESGDFVWNSGIFIWNVKTIAKAFEDHMTDLAEIFQEGIDSYFTDKERLFVKGAYSHCRNISIDYGVLEKADNVHVILADFDWSDLGSWNTLFDLRDHDESNNAVEANALLFDTSNCFIKGPQDKLIITSGLDGFLVTECDNVLMISKLGDDSVYRDIVKEVRAKKGDKYL